MAATVTAAAAPEGIADRETAPANYFVVGESFRVFPARGLPSLDSPGTRACQAQDTRNTSRMVFARICQPGVQVRLDHVDVLSPLVEMHLMRPLAWGEVVDPQISRRCLAVVFEQPAGRAPVPGPGADIEPMSGDDLARRLLAPAALSIAVMHKRLLTHRAIRPDNLYIADGDTKSFLLGDCVTGPPAMLQPAVFEPIESAMTHPIGRGGGTVEDDLYSLGATAMALAQGTIPLAGLTDTEVVEAKLAQGSFTALLGGGRAPFRLRDLLKGLLIDDPNERWTVENLEQWLGGGVRRTHKAPAIKQASRPLHFVGREYYSTRAIAHAFGKHVNEAAIELANENFINWIERSLDDAGLAERLEQLGKNAKGEGSKGEVSSTLVTSASLLLDRLAPLRYKDVTAMPDGLGPLLADAMQRGDRQKVGQIAEIISDGLAMQVAALRDSDIAARPFKRLQMLLRHSGPGYGIERCLYELNPQLRCLSGGLSEFYVQSLDGLLPALEEIAAKGHQPPSLIDRHIAAFIAARFNRNIDKALSALVNSKDRSIDAQLAMLGLYARLQYEFGPPKLPSFTRWMARELESAPQRFFNRATRDAVKSKLAKMSEGGSLIDLYEVLNQHDALRKDQAGRNAAMREFMRARKEIKEIEGRLDGQKQQLSGWKVASSLCMGIGGATMLILAVA